MSWEGYLSTEVLERRWKNQSSVNNTLDEDPLSLPTKSKRALTQPEPIPVIDESEDADSDVPEENKTKKNKSKSKLQ